MTSLGQGHTKEGKAAGQEGCRTGTTLFLLNHGQDRAPFMPQE